MLIERLELGVWLVMCHSDDVEYNLTSKEAHVYTMPVDRIPARYRNVDCITFNHFNQKRIRASLLLDESIHAVVELDLRDHSLAVYTHEQLASAPKADDPFAQEFSIPF